MDRLGIHGSGIRVNRLHQVNEETLTYFALAEYTGIIYNPNEHDVFCVPFGRDTDFRYVIFSRNAVQLVRCNAAQLQNTEMRRPSAYYLMESTHAWVCATRTLLPEMYAPTSNRTLTPDDMIRRYLLVSILPPTIDNQPVRSTCFVKYPCIEHMHLHAMPVNVVCPLNRRDVALNSRFVLGKSGDNRSAFGDIRQAQLAVRIICDNKDEELFYLSSNDKEVKQGGSLFVLLFNTYMDYDDGTLTMNKDIVYVDHNEPGGITSLTKRKKVNGELDEKLAYYLSLSRILEYIHHGNEYTFTRKHDSYFTCDVMNIGPPEKHALRPSFPMTMTEDLKVLCDNIANHFIFQGVAYAKIKVSFYDELEVAVHSVRRYAEELGNLGADSVFSRNRRLYITEKCDHYVRRYRNMYTDDTSALTTCFRDSVIHETLNVVRLDNTGAARILAESYAAFCSDGRSSTEPGEVVPTDAEYDAAIDSIACRKDAVCDLIITGYDENGRRYPLALVYAQQRGGGGRRYNAITVHNNEDEPLKKSDQQKKKCNITRPQFYETSVRMMVAALSDV